MKLLSLVLLVLLAPSSYADEKIVLREIAPRDQISRGNWWSVYADAKLDALIREASSANQDLRAAVFRFDQARALARVARSDFFPNVNVNPAITNQRFSGNTAVPFDPNGRQFQGWNYDVPVDISYEIDLWGRVRLGHQAALQDAQSAAATMQSVLLSVQAEVAQNYFRLRALDSEIASLEKAIGLLKESYDIAQTKQKAGTASEFEVTRAAAELATQRVEFAGLKSQRDQLKNAIAVLVGRKAQGFDIAATPDRLFTVPAVPRAVPSDLLERRPDIAQSERVLAANLSRLGIAKLAAYPSVRLGVNTGVVSGSLTNLFASGSDRWVIGPSVSLPIFSGGRDRSNKEAQLAAADVALAQYRQTILLAFAEVDNQMIAISRLSEQLTHQQEALTQAERSRELAKTRYDSGIGAYIELLDSERSAISTQRGIQQLRGQHLIATVTLIKALGGGWNQKMPTVVPALTPDPDSQTEKVAEPKKGFLKRMFSRG